jgi:hypothetical protein
LKEKKEKQRKLEKSSLSLFRKKKLKKKLQKLQKTDSLPAWLNEAAAREVLRATTKTTEPPQEALTGGARALKVAQATLGPAAGDAARDGVDGLDAFEASFGSAELIDGLVASAEVPGVTAAASAHVRKSGSGSSSGSSKIGGSSKVDVASFAAKKEGSRRLLAT